MEDTSVTNEGKTALRFYSGIVLMISSFLVYLVYPFIPFLYYSNRVKVILAFIVWGVAWAIFGVGFALSGKEGYRKIKNFSKALLKNRCAK